MTPSCASSPELPVPLRLHVLEGALALGVAVYCLGPWRSGPREFLVFGLAAALIAWLGTRSLPAPPSRQPAPRAWLLLGLLTGGGLGIFVVSAFARGIAPGCLDGNAARILAIYIIYAALQQYLTQRYLVVRLRGWLGTAGASSLRVAGVAAALFAVAHLPFPRLILPTALTGFVWTYAYLESGRLAPVVASHALLAAAFFVGVTEHDPFGDLPI